MRTKYLPKQQGELEGAKPASNKIKCPASLVEQGIAVSRAKTFLAF